MCEMILCPMRLNMQTDFSPDENLLPYDPYDSLQLPQLEQHQLHQQQVQHQVQHPVIPVHYKSRAKAHNYQEEMVIGNGKPILRHYLMYLAKC